MLRRKVDNLSDSDSENESEHSAYTTSYITRQMLGYLADREPGGNFKRATKSGAKDQSLEKVDSTATRRSSRKSKPSHHIGDEEFLFPNLLPDTDEINPEAKKQMTDTNYQTLQSARVDFETREDPKDETFLPSRSLTKGL